MEQALLPRIQIALLLVKSAVAHIDNHVGKIPAYPPERSKQRVPFTAQGPLLLRKPGDCLSGENIAPVLTGRTQEKKVHLRHFGNRREHIEMELRQVRDAEKSDPLRNLLHPR